jgi:16S rRNA (uracil1498-N3)-methyltransferase
MSLPRFLVPSLQSQSAALDLPEDEAHHASRVLRCQVGDSVILFDGLGSEALASIQQITKRSVTVSFDSVMFAPRDHNGTLHFAVSLPKGDRQRNTIEKLVELGVDSLTPISTERSVAIVNATNAERLHRYGVEACKQCGRNRLMIIHASSTLDQVSIDHPKCATFVLHPNIEGSKAITLPEANAKWMSSSIDSLLFLIGPEGGFTDAEVRRAIAQGAVMLSLGERIQRVETAVSSAAVLGSCWLPK